MIVWSLWRKRLVRQYFAFFLYCCFEVTSQWVILVLWHASPSAYFYVFWFAEIISSTLLIAVIQSLLQQPVHRLGTFARLSNILFYVLGITATGVIFWAASGNNAFEEFDLIRALVAIDSGLRFVQATLLILVAVLALRFSLQWQLLAKYILGGIAVLVVSELLVTTVRTVVGAQANAFGRFFRPTAYLAGVCIWFYFLCLARTRESKSQLKPLRTFRQSLEEVAR
jgi:hypothetical protein